MDKSIMFSRAMMEDAGIGLHFSSPLTLLGTEGETSAISGHKQEQHNDKRK